MHKRLNETNHVFRSTNNSGWQLEVENSLYDDGDAALIFYNVKTGETTKPVYLNREQRSELSDLLESLGGR